MSRKAIALWAMYGRDSPKTSESIVGRQLGTICFSNKEHDSMVLCISELSKIFILLSIRNVSNWRGESRCFSVFEVRLLLSTDWVHEHVRQNTRKSNLSRDWIETLKHMVAQRAGVQLEAKTGSKYYLITEYRSIFMRQLKEMLHLGTPANVQDVLVQDHANNLPYKCGIWS